MLSHRWQCFSFGCCFTNDTHIFTPTNENETTFTPFDVLIIAIRLLKFGNTNRKDEKCICVVWNEIPAICPMLVLAMKIKSSWRNAYETNKEAKRKISNLLWKPRHPQSSSLIELKHHLQQSKNIQKWIILSSLANYEQKTIFAEHLEAKPVHWFSQSFSSLPFVISNPNSLLCSADAAAITK